MTLSWTEFTTQMALAAREKKELFAAGFELTPRCNLQCKMCYVSHPPNDKQAAAKELTAAQWIRIAEEARDEGLLFLTLTGGEVFIREDFKIIYERLMNLGFLIQIYTNGTMITPDIVNWLATIPPSKVSITLYGASRETYRSVTGYAEGFDKTVRAIDALLAKNIPVEVKTTIVKGNLHEFDDMVNLALQRKLQLGIVNYVSPNREGCNSDPIGNRLSPQELFQFENHMTELSQKIAAENAERISMNTDSAAPEIQGEFNDGQKEAWRGAFKCSAGTCAAWVTWDGRLVPCALMDIPETYPLEKGVHAAWEELKLKSMLIPVNMECQVCAYESKCEHCPARCYRETGQFDLSAPYLCETARLRTQHNNNQKSNIV